MKHNWEYKRLGDVCEILDSLRKPVTKSDRVKGIYPYYGASGIQDYVDDYIFDGDYLLVGEDGAKWGSNEKSAFTISGKTWVNNHAHVLDFKNSIVSHRLVEYYICNLDLNAIVTGAVVPKLTQKNLVSISIPVPPMAVQEQIVAELDKINEVIADCRELLRNLNALSKSLFYDYFGDPISNPKAWETKKIEDMCSLKSGDSSANNLPEGDTPYVKVSDMNLDENQYGIKTSSKFVNIGNKTNLLFPIGTTIFPKRGGAILTNKKRLTKVSICCDLNIMGVIPKHINCIYLFYYFVLLDFKELIDGSTVPQINNADIYPLIVPVPPLELQEKFAARIEQIEEQKKAVEQTIAELQTLLDSRMDYWFN